MEIVIAFTKSDEGGDDMIAGAVSVVERLVAEPVSQAVHAECSLLDEEDSQDSGIDLCNSLILIPEVRVAGIRTKPPIQSFQPNPQTRVGKTRPIEMTHFWKGLARTAHFESLPFMLGGAGRAEEAGGTDKVVSMLPDDHWVFVQVRNVGSANSLRILLEARVVVLG